MLNADDGLSDEASVTRSFGSPPRSAALFLTDHLLAFEITSIVLLVAAVGGVVLGMTVAAEEDDALVIGPDIDLVPRRRGDPLRDRRDGVILRRSPLIVLLSLEIMLNASNLALVGLLAPLRSVDGQIFAISVMAVAAAEVVVGLGLIVAFTRRKMPLDVDTLTELRG